MGTVALYERLSRDDELQGESNSISTQKKILEEYARQRGYTSFVHFTDDGISGTRFDRPGFVKMLADIDKGLIDTVIIKDMSRLGRDYLKVGQVMEDFRKKNIRLIAINDGVDTFSREDDFTPFRNIMNEWYAKDASRKIKSSFRSKGESGKPTSSNPPYGYLKDKDDKYKWVIDEKAAEIVRRIYTMTMQGYGPYKIAKILEEEKVDIPAYHQQKMGAGLHQKKDFKYPYRWCSSTIASMLAKEEYLGHTVNFKTRKHYKDKKSYYVSRDNWLIIKNTHEPIIDEETFYNVQRIRGNVKRYPDGWGVYHPLTGLMYCKDCGSKMYVHRTSNYKNVPYYICSAYSKVPCGSKCKSAHRVKAENIIELIKTMLMEIKEKVKNDREMFIQTIKADIDEVARKKHTEINNKLPKLEDRKNTLENLMCRIYEDMIMDKIPQSRYNLLNAQYEEEQKIIDKEIQVLKKELEELELPIKDPNKFLNILDRYQDFSNIDTYTINEFIEKIVVHERELKGVQNSPQVVEVYFNFIGEYKLDEVELSGEELEELRLLEEKRKRLHENYLKRKANGKQKEYEEKYKAKRENLKAEKQKKLDKAYVKLKDYEGEVHKDRRVGYVGKEEKF